MNNTMSSLDNSQMTVTSEEIMKEIHTFVSGATRGSNANSHELAKCAIFLLKTVPATKEAVLEHLCNVFDEAVSSHLYQLELENSGTVGVTSKKFDESIIQDVHSVLSQFISSNPEAWSPIISTWSLDLLGQLSSKYCGRRAVPLGGTLTELLQLWMTCRATRTLIDITTQCISTLINSNPDRCIDALLETSVQHSPNFDWVVAHIGSCFPKTIITRVLACGLKDFCTHDSQTESTSTLMAEKKVPKLASVVGILGHLANQHSEDIRKALLSLFHESFSPQPTAQHLATIPFLLQLASMSNMLLRVITTDFVTTLNADILNRMSEQIPHWRSSCLPDIDGLIGLVVHLVLRSEEGGIQVIIFLLNTADGQAEMASGVSPKVHKTCGLILDSLLLELQRLIYTSCVADVPLLHCLQQNVSLLSSQILTSSDKVLDWLLPVMTSVCLHGGERISSSVLVHLLMNLESEQLISIIRLLNSLESTQPTLLQTTVSHVINQMTNADSKLVCKLVKNLLSFLEYEIGGKLHVRSMLAPLMFNNMSALACQLIGPSFVAADIIIKMLPLISLADKVPVNIMVCLSKAVVKYFFHTLKYKDNVAKIHHVSLCKVVIGRLCQNASIQRFIIRLLIEGTTSFSLCYLFGGKTKAKTTQNLHETTKLLEENRKHAVTITLPVSHSSVFHAGIIGKGLRAKSNIFVLSKTDILINSQCLIEIFQKTCTRYDYNNRTNDGAVNLALLLVETLSPDVMFNGLPWPEDDFMKVTVERDLHIQRCFEDCPVLWSILKLLANSRPSLCYCSVLLRALSSVMISFWGSCQEKCASNCPKQLEMTCKLIDLMAVSQLLPPPLSYASELFPHLSPYEICIIFYDIWRYMREYVPSPALFSEVNNVYRRDFQLDLIKTFTVRLRFVLQNNIDKFGSVFGKFFS